MLKMIGQISDASPKVTLVQAGDTESVKLDTVNIYNDNATTAAITVYISEKAATSAAANIVYYAAALAAKGVVQLTGLSLGQGQKIEVFSDAATGITASAFGDRKTAY